MKDVIKKILSEGIEVKNKILRDESLLDLIEKISLVIIKAYQNKKKVILFGNGGSAADAQHIAGELVNKLSFERKALPAIALTTDTSVLTSIANDYDYSKVFARQVEALAEDGDVVIGISTSGNSASVLEGIRAARKKAYTVGFTGRGENRLSNIVDIALRVPSEDTPRIQEVHIAILHIICCLIEKKLFGSRSEGQI
jgi:D-sedoheptulose 7-phosphate isomerase